MVKIEERESEKTGEEKESNRDERRDLPVQPELRKGKRKEERSERKEGFFGLMVMILLICFLVVGRCDEEKGMKMREKDEEERAMKEREREEDVMKMMKNGR